ncbi:hypothetical protein X948_5428 [Burkholderia pseudomallei MSHR5608]|nr:hypothetical protein X948_5428 [Burkholderia pseudomallei MSHR5608]
MLLRERSVPNSHDRLATCAETSRKTGYGRTVEECVPYVGLLLVGEGGRPSHLLSVRLRSCYPRLSSLDE